MKEYLLHFYHRGWRSPKFFNKNDIDSAFMKYDEGCSALGAKRVDSVDEAKHHLSVLQNLENGFGKTDVKVLIQEFVDGEEFIIDTVSCNGKHYITDIWKYERVIDDGKYLLTLTNLVEAIDEKINQIVDYTFKVMSAVDFKFGVSHNEIKYDSKGPVLIEVNPRPQGSGNTREYLKKILGHCVVDLSLDSMLGNYEFSKHLYPSAPYKTLMHSSIKTPIVKSAKRGMTNSGALISSCLPSFVSCYYFTPPGLRDVPKTEDFETSPYALKLCSDSASRLHDDIVLLNELEQKYPNLLVCDNEAQLCAIQSTIDLLKFDQSKKFEKQNDTIKSKLPYGKDSFELIRRFICANN